MTPSTTVHQVEKSSDAESAEVISAIVKQLPSSEGGTEWHNLQEQQVMELADLRGQQMREERHMEQQLDEELYRKQREVVQQLEEQKKLVRVVSGMSPVFFPYLGSVYQVSFSVVFCACGSSICTAFSLSFCTSYLYLKIPPPTVSNHFYTISCSYYCIILCLSLYMSWTSQSHFSDCLTYVFRTCPCSYFFSWTSQSPLFPSSISTFSVLSGKPHCPCLAPIHPNRF